MHARIRNKCSGLNSDLLHNYLRNSQLCTCSVEPEDAEHYVFRCNLFVIQRLHFLNFIQHLNPLNLNNVLFGKPSLTERENSELFVSVQEYIQQTVRFTWYKHILECSDLSFLLCWANGQNLCLSSCPSLSLSLSLLHIIISYVNTCIIIL